ncbi:MAG: DUF1722 domain-containing protein [Desulfosarcinaceae bacterium]
MRIWDINPGYLNRQSLLGEHRELHGIVSIRHKLLACEMALRGYTDRSPVTTGSNRGKWPDAYIDSPGRQFMLLRAKYVGKEEGRIPLPRNQQQLWGQHKYSVLARNPNLYKKIGVDVSKMAVDFDRLCTILTEILREQPKKGGIRNAVQHMWGYVSDGAMEIQRDINTWPLRRLLSEVQKRAYSKRVPYLIASTALSELMVWLPGA